VEPQEIVDTLQRYTITVRLPIVFDAEKSHDGYLYDRLSNSEFLDFLTFSGVNPIGFNHPAIRDPKFLERLSRAALSKPNPTRFLTPELAEWVETFVRICGRNYFRHYFFIDVGTLAVENALKTAFDWKVRKNMKKGLRPDLPMGIIHFKEAFHGRSGYTLSLTNTADPRKHEYFPKFDWPRITNPKCRFPLTGKNLEQVVALEKKAFEEIESVIKTKGNELAALIIEPVQCDGGDNHFRPEFLQGLRRICDEHELLFIVDEIQTGMGVTGKIWAFEHYGIVPDIVCFCKKSQVGGIAVTERIDDVDNVFRIPSRIGSTSGGNLIDMIRATRVLQIIEEERLLENAGRMGAFLTEELGKLARDFPEKIDNLRGLGLLVAFDLPTQKEREEFVRRCFEKKLLVMTAEPRTIRLRPFLDLKKEHILKLVSICRETLREMRGGS
jgi:L-lysine 6-transaminase